MIRKRIRKAVIPAAGYGMRFLPMTKAIPKEMLPIVDKPVIQYVVEEALQSGIEEILIISGHGKRAIEDHFDTNMDLELLLKQKGKTKLLSMVQHISEINVHYIRQKHMRGLGDAILCAKSFVDDEPFAVLLGDDVVYNESQPALRQLLGVYAKVGTTVLGCQKVRKEQVSSYGIVDGISTSCPDLLKVVDMVEKPTVDQAPSCVAALGRYIFTPDIFEILQRIPVEPHGKLQLTDAIKIMARREAVYAYNFKGQQYDAGDKLGYLKAMMEYALRRDDLKDEFREYLQGIIKE
ncbi:UTP--glucose-1-phosphate uridylyltransferase GalU [Megasphaera stantonii]|uniref:UTP--glucose-1-phosphate uridylyltransferase GalU n=1 Tax=Megasphaera stantonii TaxID=2144175 RepID=UPI00195EA0B6|nr:UTP--glucose-1-phosphate uridylyltransferase GalU [Megasphaera stantonii]MBM6733377.1 UTP--glucose-1-phosphate uridylyltransferase GalU [Megasphaera stantonii]